MGGTKDVQDQTTCFGCLPLVCSCWPILLFRYSLGPTGTKKLFGPSCFLLLGFPSQVCQAPLVPFDGKGKSHSQWEWEFFSGQLTVGGALEWFPFLVLSGSPNSARRMSDQSGRRINLSKLPSFAEAGVGQCWIWENFYWLVFETSSVSLTCVPFPGFIGTLGKEARIKKSVLSCPD